MTFKDHFSQRAALYCAFRPAYPPAMFDLPGAVVPRAAERLGLCVRQRQATVALAERFEAVIATDGKSAAACRCAVAPERDIPGRACRGKWY